MKKHLETHVQNKFNFFDDAETMALAVVNVLARLILKFVLERGVCHMVLPGGRSPYHVFSILCKEKLPWSCIQLYISDERCVPLDASERNDKLINELFIASGVLPKGNFHPIPAECGPDKGAEFYTELLAQTPQFDIVLLGVGDDGHTASLFPGSKLLMDRRAVVPVYDAPKAPANRVSIGLCRLLTAHIKLVLISGYNKREVVNRIQCGENLPATQILPTMIFSDVYN